MLPDHPEISIVVPVFEEGTGLNAFARSVDEELAKITSSYEILFIDDGSADSTWDVLQGISAVLPRVRAIGLSRNFGKESAIAAGLDHARGKAIVVMDGDGQHPPSLLPLLVQPWRAGDADIVEAVKEDRGQESWTKRIGSAAFYAIMRILSGWDLQAVSDFKLFDRRVLESWSRMREHSLFFRGMFAWIGYRRATVPFSVATRQSGFSRWSVWKLFIYGLRALTSFSSAPLYLVNVTGLAFFVFAIAVGGKAAFDAATGQAVSGFLTVILLQLITGSLLMLALGVLGAYVARIYDEVKARPRYFVARTLKL